LDLIVSIRCDSSEEFHRGDKDYTVTGNIIELVTEDAVALSEHFAVDEQISRADLHRRNDDEGAASLLRS
jgi:hypothetical protein